MLSVHGQKTAIIISKNDYEKLSGKKPHLVDFLQASPLIGIGLDLQRDTSFHAKCERF